MKRDLLRYLCDPIDGSDLRLHSEVMDGGGNIIRGTLATQSGRAYPIRDGIPRFVEYMAIADTVTSFGDEWNFFNYDRFKLNWLEHVVGNTFGSLDTFKGKVIVDAGGGSGLQTRWMAEAGASHVICLELSHSVDGVMRKNLAEMQNVDVIQCSIDQLPLKAGSIPGIVICHNVIQHTPSVYVTARALWNVVGPGGEFVFNCYSRNDYDAIRAVRYQLHAIVRHVVSRRSFSTRLAYAKIMAALRFLPLVGIILEKSNLMYRGPIPAGPDYLKRAFWQGALNTFDEFGAHEFQHYEKHEDIKRLVESLPNKSEVRNADRYFAVPPSPGCALRVFKAV